MAEKCVNSFEGDRNIYLKRGLTLYASLRGVEIFSFFIRRRSKVFVDLHEGG